VKQNANLAGINILPLSYNEKYFGSLLQDKLKIEYLNKIFEKCKVGQGPI
jgi:hypothetical protein